VFPVTTIIYGIDGSSAWGKEKDAGYLGLLEKMKSRRGGVAGLRLIRGLGTG
jgi:hypothetical protein